MFINLGATIIQTGFFKKTFLKIREVKIHKDVYNSQASDKGYQILSIILESILIFFPDIMD